MEAVRLRLVQAGVDALPSVTNPDTEIPVSPDSLLRSDNESYLEKLVDHEVSTRQIQQKYKDDAQAMRDGLSPELKTHLRHEQKAQAIRPHIEKLMSGRKLKEVFEADRAHVIDTFASIGAREHDFQLEGDVTEAEKKQAGLSPFDRLLSGGNYSFGDDRPTAEDAAIITVSQFTHWLE